MSTFEDWPQVGEIWYNRHLKFCGKITARNHRQVWIQFQAGPHTRTERVLAIKLADPRNGWIRLREVKSRLELPL